MIRSVYRQWQYMEDNKDGLPVAVQSQNTVNRLQTSTISIRVTPEMKALAKAGAAADGRSLSNYLTALIRADAERRGIKPKPAKSR